MAPQVQRPDPAYLQIARHIRQQIAVGELRDGDLVPSARQIMQDWGVAMATAMRALERLRSEGLVRAAPGVGTVVTFAGTSKQTPQERVRTARKTGKIYPTNERAEIRSSEVVPAPENIANELALEPGAPVIKRHRVTFRDDVPVSASVSWFHGRLAETAPRLLETERILKGTFGYIEEQTGRVLAGGEDKKAADAATDRDAEDLGIPVGSPVLRGRNWFFDQDGEVLEYGESVAIAGRWTTHEYEITSED